MDDRTKAFLGSQVLIVASVVFWFGLIRAWANTHPDSPTSHAAMKLIG